tara:strand:- start:17 stop:328 length:312 start_codon:yes stop_codon:yes gene_type:complete
MIDEKKYEGHTEGPWAYREDEVYAEGNPCIVALRAHGTDGELTSKLPHRWADFALIADAPLLLAEVKRLREEKELMVTYLRYMRDGELTDKDWLTVNDWIGED